MAIVNESETKLIQALGQQEGIERHLPELLALQSEAESARVELMASGADQFSDFEFTQLVRLIYPYHESGRLDFPQQIEADRAAIKRALSDGTWAFTSALISLQGKQMDGTENQPRG